MSDPYVPGNRNIGDPLGASGDLTAAVDVVELPAPTFGDHPDLRDNISSHLMQSQNHQLNQNQLPGQGGGQGVGQGGARNISVGSSMEAMYNMYQSTINATGMGAVPNIEAPYGTESEFDPQSWMYDSVGGMKVGDQAGGFGGVSAYMGVDPALMQQQYIAQQMAMQNVVRMQQQQQQQQQQMEQMQQMLSLQSQLNPVTSPMLNGGMGPSSSAGVGVGNYPSALLGMRPHLADELLFAGGSQDTDSSGDEGRLLSPRGDGRDSPRRRPGPKPRVITNCQHADRRHYAHGKCQACYRSAERRAQALASPDSPRLKGKADSPRLNRRGSFESAAKGSPGTVLSKKDRLNLQELASPLRNVGLLQADTGSMGSSVGDGLEGATSRMRVSSFGTPGKLETVPHANRVHSSNLSSEGHADLSHEDSSAMGGDDADADNSSLGLDQAGPLHLDGAMDRVAIQPRLDSSTGEAVERNGIKIESFDDIDKQFEEFGVREAVPNTTG